MCIIFITGVLTAGCAVGSTVPSDQTWPDDKYMARLDRQVDELCTSLVEGITPGCLYITWQDNLHPHRPLLSETYVVSMCKRKLTSRGYTITTGEQDAEFMLSLIMTPQDTSLLVLASIKNNDRVLAAREAYLTRGDEKWNRVLSSKRYQTKTRISLGSNP